MIRKFSIITMLLLVGEVHAQTNPWTLPKAAADTVTATDGVIWFNTGDSLDYFAPWTTMKSKVDTLSGTVITLQSTASPSTVAGRLSYNPTFGILNTGDGAAVQTFYPVGLFGDNRICQSNNPSAQVDCDIDTSAELASVLTDETGTGALVFASALSGFVSGPASSVDNFIPVWDGTTGKLLKNQIHWFVSGTGILTHPNIGTGAVQGLEAFWDDQGNRTFGLNAVGSAVNYISLTNSSAGNPVPIVANGTDTNIGIDIDTKGSGALTVNGVNVLNAATTVTKSMHWGAGAISPDGTNCVAPTEQTLNGGPKVWAFSCADNAASIFYGNTTMPDGWNAGTVTFELTLQTPVVGVYIFAGDVSAQCRGNNEAVSSTWGTAVQLDLGPDTDESISQGTSGAVTPDGTCAAGDALFWRYVVDDVNFDASAASALVLGVKMEYASTVSD